MAPKYSTTLKTVKVGGKSYKQSTITASSFNKAVKKVINKEAETKSFISTAYTFTGSSDVVYCANLVAPMTQGTGEGQYIGEKMQIKNIHLKAVISRLVNETVFMRVLLIRTKQPITATSSNGITYTDVFRGGATSVATIGMVDLNKVSLVYDKLITVPEASITSTLGQRNWSYNLKLNKKVTWDTSNGSYLKDANYYLICVPQNPSNTPNIAFFRLQYTVNFKDI